MLLDALDQYKHLVLCLRPATPEAEGDIIQAAMKRHRPMALHLDDDKQPSRAFLVATTWWRRWLQYVGKEKKGSGNRNGSTSSVKSAQQCPRRLNRLRRGSTASATMQASKSVWWRGRLVVTSACHLLLIANLSSCRQAATVPTLPPHPTPRHPLTTNH